MALQFLNIYHIWKILRNGCFLQREGSHRIMIVHSRQNQDVSVRQCLVFIFRHHIYHSSYISINSQFYVEHWDKKEGFILCALFCKIGWWRLWMRPTSSNSKKHSRLSSSACEVVAAADKSPTKSLYIKWSTAFWYRERRGHTFHMQLVSWPLYEIWGISLLMLSKWANKIAEWKTCLCKWYAKSSESCQCCLQVSMSQV